MAADFFDTSALVKYYQAENGSAVILQIVSSAKSSIFIARLANVETESAGARKYRSGAASAGDLQFFRRRFARDLRTKLFCVSQLPRDYYEAALMVRSHGANHGLRTLDALQLAVALRLARAGAIDRIVSADRVLLAVAAIEGVAVLNPEGA